MDIAQVAQTAETFLKDYVTKNNNFTPEDELTEDPRSMRIFFFRAVPSSSRPNTIMYAFVFGRKLTQTSPEIQQRVDQCMAALKEAHPEVNQFKSHINLKPAA